MAKYYIKRNEVVTGPFEAHDLVWQIDGDTLIRAENSEQWQKASEVEEVRNILQSFESQRSADKNEEHKTTEQTEIKDQETPAEETTTQAETESETGIQQETTEETKPPRPQNYLTMAILSTLLCNLWVGIVAIIFATKVNSSYDAGDYEKAEQYSQKAKTWSWITIGVGLITLIIYLILFATGVMP